MCTTILWKPVTPENGPGMCSCKRAGFVDDIMAGSICHPAIRNDSSAIWYGPILAFLPPTEPSSTEKAAFAQQA